MSDSVEVTSMSEPKEELVESSCSSHEVTSAFNMNNYHRTSNVTPLLDGTKGNRGREFVIALRAKVKNDHDEYNKAELVAKERRWIGTLVTKIFDGERNMGHVVDFDEETGRFQILYKDSDKQEEVYKEVLRTLVPDPKLVCEYLDRVEARKNEEKEKKRGAAAVTAPISLKKGLPSKSSDQQTKGKEVKSETTGNLGQKRATYVPLAFKEKKKDAYIWY